MKRLHHISKGLLGSIWIIALLLLLNAATTVWHSRFDFTNEKRFTLSKGTKLVLKKITNPITIDIFLKGNYPSGFKKLASSTTDILNEYKEISGNKIQFRFVAPEEKIEGTDVSYADTLTSMGLFPINLTAQLKDGQQQQQVYPFALLKSGSTSIPVELYKGKTPLINFKELNDAEALLEYNFANAIAKFIQKEKPSIGYAIGNGEPMDYSVYDLAEVAIKPNYDLQLINLSEQAFINPAFKTLLIVKPTIPFTDQQKLKIDQFVMQGGSVVFCVDRLNAEMDSLRIKNEVVAYDRELNIYDLLFRYGVRINPNLLMDLQCDYIPFDVNGNGQFEFLPWNYFPVLESADNHPINKNLGYVAGKFVNGIDTIETPGIEKTVLLHSSPNARLISSPAIISGSQNVTAPEDQNYRTANVPVAVLLEGKFKSFFANRLTSALNDSLIKADMAFLPACIKDNKIVVVSDGDLLLNSVSKGNEPLAMGMNMYTFGTQRAFPFANKDFLLNTLDYLINENDLSEAKNKDYTLKLLDTKKINAEKTQWQVVNIAIPILLVIVFALIFQGLRKRKYARK